MFCLVGLGRSEERNVLDELLDTPEDDDLDVELCRTDKKLRSKQIVHSIGFLVIY
jgi:hypothetical protein